MIKPIWAAVGGIAILGTAGIGGALLVTSSGGEEEVVQQVETATATALPTAAATDSPSPTPSSTAVPSATPVSTSGATVGYTDPTYGYSFNYPRTWHLLAAGKAGSVTLYSYDPATAVGEPGPVPTDKLKVLFWVAEDVDKPLEQWLAEGDNSPGQITPPTILLQTETSVGGKPGLMRVIESEGLKYISYYVPLGGGRIFVINGGNRDAQAWPQFEPVLNSTRFAS